MKILQIGIGSIGKRRIRSLKALNETDIIGFDLREDRRKEAEEEFGIETFATFKEALKEKPEIFIISTDPDQHLQYQFFAVSNNIHFFTEASVIREGIKEVINLLDLKNLTRYIVGMPSSTMRFHPTVKRMKFIVENEIGKICTFTHHVGQYLPDWHTNEKITDYWVSKKKTGGGRELLPFELNWLTWIFGKIINVKSFIGNTLNFGDGIDDIYHVLMKFESGLIAHLLVDVVSRKYIRHTKLLCASGVLEFDIIIDDKIYIAEIKHFLNVVKKKEKASYTFEEDLKILDLRDKIEFYAN